jgi:eukaryotic-like serine/threonine-protein kinase
MESGSRLQAPRQLGRYAIYGQIGSGGMATVHFGRLLGPSGFARPVAIKRLHEQFASDREFAEMLIDEAHTASRIAHVNVVPTLDVIAEENELWLVMEYVNGESLARLLDAAAGQPLPVAIAAAVLTGMLHGLHAAHETRNEGGELLGIVHRDVSPDNVLVGIDGVPRLADFGVAKARGRVRTTPAGQVKGKLAYMPCEQLRGREVDRRADVYGAGAVLWEALTGRMLFNGASEGEVIARVLNDPVPPPSRSNGLVPAVLDQVTLRALSREPAERFATARDMATAIEASLRVASQSELADWLQRVAGSTLSQRAAQLRTMVEAGPLHERADTVTPSTRVTPGGSNRVQSSTRRLSDPVREPGSEPRDLETDPTAAARPAAGSQTRPVGPRLWPLWVGLALLALGAGIWISRGGSEPASPAPPVVAAPPPAEPRVEPPAAAAPASPTVPTKVEAAPAVEAPSKTPLQRRPRGSKRQAATAKPVEVDCAPPYYLDADGIRHVKRDCL